MRHIAQPGPPATARIVAAVSHGLNFEAELPKGALLLKAVANAFAERGFSSGVLRFWAGGLAPFAYVIPALPTTSDHAAFYSKTYRPKGVTQLQFGAMTLGQLNTKPFFHCHAFWREADGTARGGHILPDETHLAERLIISATGLKDAHFESQFDEETGFKLLSPLGGGRGAFHALRLRPNQDLGASLQAYCHAQGISRALIHGGVGSLIGASYRGGRVSEPFATEMAIESGIVDADGTFECEIRMIDYQSNLTSGTLRLGDNPVLMTMELVLEALL